MIVKILKTLIANAQTFLVTWVVIILANQLFIFGACFAPYCIIAAIPHTFVIAALGLYFYTEINAKTEENNKTIKPIYRIHDEIEKSGIDLSTLKSNLLAIGLEPPETENQKGSNKNNQEEPDELTCPKCGSEMTLRVARRGAYTGQKFWGCTNYPKCKGIINITQ